MRLERVVAIVGGVIGLGVLGWLGFGALKLRPGVADENDDAPALGPVYSPELLHEPSTESEVEMNLATDGAARITWKNDAGAPRVYHAERLYGLDARLINFCQWWVLYGSFAIVITSGGRFDEVAQRALFDRGVSNAATLAETPHGRLGAFDFAPVLAGSAELVQSIYTGDEKDAVMRAEALRLYGALADAAEGFGLESGRKYKIGPQKLPDHPHVQVKDWKRLSYPPLRV